MFYEKLKKSIKRKSKMLLNMLIPGHIPEFGVFNSKNPIFFVYFINGDIFYISHSANVEFSEVIIDEVIKVGIENDEFVFYPSRGDSAFFRQNFEIDTFRFIELILHNNLNVVVSEILGVIESFERKILDYQVLYRQRLENAICNIDFIDRHGILGISANLKWEAENALKAQIIEIAKENALDSKEHIFEILFGRGIYEVENISENAITQDKILSYYNRSNLTNCVENEIAISMNVNLQMRFFISYFIDSIFLRANENGKIFADSKIIIKTLSLQGSPKFCYSNNDLKIEFIGENIIIYNLQKISVILQSIKSKFIVGNDESAFEVREILNIDDKKLIKNSIFLKNLHLNLEGKILHKLELIYSVNGDEKRFVGSGSIKIVDIF